MQKQGLFLLMSVLLLLAALFLSACHTNNDSSYLIMSPYPESNDQESSEISPVIVDWPTARQKIMEGKVKQVTQTHDLQIVLELKTGDQWQTSEPSIDDVFKIVNNCGKPCKNMILATE